MIKLILSIALLGNAITCLWNTSGFTISNLHKDSSKEEMFRPLQDFEAEFVYPFSETEEFRIQHGRQGNYFAFFEQLGKPYYYVAFSGKNKEVIKKNDGQDTLIHQKAGEIAAAGCCVLREMPTRMGKKINAWYLCDLKVNKKYQGEHLPFIMSKGASFWRHLQCPRGFAICMNPLTGDPKAVSIFKKHGSSLATKYTTIHTLNLYTLSLNQLNEVRGAIAETLVSHGYMKHDQQLITSSTQGVKDYEIFNRETKTKRPWNLLHLTAGDASQDVQELEDATYMICSIEGTPLDTDFKKVLGNPSSTAQVVSYGMEDVDFNCITSNQI